MLFYVVSVLLIHESFSKDMLLAVRNAIPLAVREMSNELVEVLCILGITNFLDSHHTLRTCDPLLFHREGPGTRM